MAYSGKFIPTNPEKYKGDAGNIVYRSLWEKHAFTWADTSSGVKAWSSEEVVIPYYYQADKKYHRYFMDLKLVLENGTTILVEIKPFKETQVPTNPGKQTKRYINESLTYIKNQNKWKAAEKYASDRGWDFQIWTENELGKMGILPKMKSNPIPRAKSFPKKPPGKRLKGSKSMKPFPKFGKK